MVWRIPVIFMLSHTRPTPLVPPPHMVASKVGGDLTEDAHHPQLNFIGTRNHGWLWT